MSKKREVLDDDETELEGLYFSSSVAIAVPQLPLEM